MKQINKDLLECFSTTVGMLATIKLTCLAFFGHGDVGLLHLDDCRLFSGFVSKPSSYLRKEFWVSYKPLLKILVLNDKTLLHLA